MLQAFLRSRSVRPAGVGVTVSLSVTRFLTERRRCFLANNVSVCPQISPRHISETFILKLKSIQNPGEHLFCGLLLIHTSSFFSSLCVCVSGRAAVPPPVTGSSERPYFFLTKQTKHTTALFSSLSSYLSLLTSPLLQRLSCEAKSTI